MTEATRAIEAVWRIESARLIAGLARMTGDVGLAEDMAQDALVAAMETWPQAGVPDNPGAWLFHCHIAWHASNGLSLTFLERMADLKDQITAQDKKDYADNCAAWKEYFDGQTVVSQIDSGLKVRGLGLGLE